MKEKIAWAALFILAIVLIVGGFQGAIGKLLACLMAPSQIVDDSKF